MTCTSQPKQVVAKLMDWRHRSDCHIHDVNHAIKKWERLSGTTISVTHVTFYITRTGMMPRIEF